jgi:prohibitin 1
MNKQKKKVKGNIMEEVNVGKLVKSVLAGLAVLTVALGSYSIVSPGERGVLVRAGKPSGQALSEGFHFKAPIIDTIKTISVRVQKSEASSEAGTVDLQRVTATLALNWNINPEKVTEMYSKIGDEHDILERIIKPAVSETLKSAVAKMTAEEVLTKRLELKNNIDRVLVERLVKYNITVQDISLVDLDFTKEFNHAVEQKQIAEQEAQQAKYHTQKAEQDAKASVNKARGEAESTLVKAKAEAESKNLLKQTLTKDIIQLEYLKRWNGQLPSIMTGNGGGMMLQLPTNLDDTGKRHTSLIRRPEVESNSNLAITTKRPEVEGDTNE